MLIAFFSIAAIAFIMIAAKVNLAFQFKKQVKTLFAQSKPIEKTFHFDQLDSLPAPVRRYFKLVLKEGQPYISYARFTHDGLFKSDEKKGWTNITGEQYATTEKPGFIWKGTTSMFVARDFYISDAGQLIVSLFSLFKVVDAKGAAYDQGELLRWLGESVLYPTNFLPSERLRWSAVDENSAKLTFDHAGLSLFFIVRFNEIGEITQLEAKRQMDATRLETWIINASEYRAMNAVRVPTVFEVLWRLEKGDLSYAKFNVKTLEYDKPEMFE